MLRSSPWHIALTNPDPLCPEWNGSGLHQSPAASNRHRKLEAVQTVECHLVGLRCLQMGWAAVNELHLQRCRGQAAWLLVFPRHLVDASPSPFGIGVVRADENLPVAAVSVPAHGPRLWMFIPLGPFAEMA